jgi:hypothetical protein
MSKLKQTFLDIRGSGYTEESLYAAVADITGISVSAIVEIAYGQRKLSTEEFNAFGRCPADILPDEIVVARKAEVVAFFKQPCLPIIGDADWELMETNNWENVEDDNVLSKPARIMKGFTRIRPRRLLQTLTDKKLWTPMLRKAARLCYRGNFNNIRYCATLSMMLLGNPMQCGELMWILENGGAAMDAHDWVKACKAHHAFVKSTHRFLLESRQLAKSEVCLLLYFQNLAGRDHFITAEATLEEVRTRTATVHPYTTVCGDAIEFQVLSVERWKSLMQQTGLLRKARSWDTFLEQLYVKLPSGSCRLSKKMDFNEFAEVIGLGGQIDGGLRGNKRLEAEIRNLGHFSKFDRWLVYAFLKYEVSKNRWLYPTSFDYVVLGLYLMDHMDEAFYNVSGVDMGHDLFGGIATKLDVLTRVTRGDACMNTDGANFNAKHHTEDLEIVYDVIKGTVPADHANEQTYQDVQGAAHKYVQMLKGRRVVIPRMPGAGGGMGFVVDHTLFSGESTTMLVNTVEIGSLGMSAADYLVNRNALAWLLLFWKGDDLNGFTHSWLVALLVLKCLERSGMEIESSKDHVEYGFSEHERCIVTSAGYGGSLARKVGAIVAAEPQGSLALTLEEALQNFNEARMCLVCRGVEPGKALAMFEAGLRTYMDASHVDSNIWRLCHIPKVNGGYGLWSTKKYYATAHGALPAVETRVKIKRQGTFGQIGSAKMTDTYLRHICESYGKEVSDVLSIRDTMVGDSGLVGLGPQRYGSRRFANLKAISKRGAEMVVKPMYAVSLNASAKVIATHVLQELRRLIREPHTLRHCGLKTPAQCIDEALSKSGCLNLALYMALNDIHNRRAALRGLSAHPEGEVNERMMERLWAKGDEIAMLFLEDKLPCAFWSVSCRINGEIATLIQRMVIYWLARSALHPSLVFPKQLPQRVAWDILAVMVAKEVWRETADILHKLTY